MRVVVVRDALDELATRLQRVWSTTQNDNNSSSSSSSSSLVLDSFNVRLGDVALPRAAAGGNIVVFVKDFHVFTR